MKRVERSWKNFYYGIISQGISSLMSFVIRFVLIRTLGMQAVSLNGLFTEVIAMLSLAELGVGSAIVYHLYGPLKEKDEKRLAQLMNLYKTAYRIIALVILAVGLMLLPYIHLLVSKIDIDRGYLRLVYFLFLVQTASSYLLSYKTSLLGADQKNYVVSLYNMIVRVVFDGITIIFLLGTHNYIVYLLLQITMTFSINIAISIQANRLYPFLKRKERLPVKEAKQVLSNIKHIFVEVLSGKIINSTDNILISTMIGTLNVGAYSSYTMIVHAISALLIQMHHATTGSIGNLMAEGKNSYTEVVLRRLTFITYCPTVLAAVGVYTVSTPFIRLLYGEEYLLPMSIVFMCVFNFLFQTIKNPLWYMVGISGFFAQNKNIAVLGSILNLVLSIILGRSWGILGIVLGTGAALIIQVSLKVLLFFRRFLHLPAGAYVSLMVRLIAVGVLCMMGGQAICRLISVTNLYLKIFLYGICSEALAIGVNLLFFHSIPEFQYAIETGKALLRKYLPQYFSNC